MSACCLWHVESRTVSWFEQASSHAHDERRASHAEAVAYVEARRVNAYENLIVVDDRPLDFPELKEIGGAVPVLNDRLHLF